MVAKRRGIDHSSKNYTFYSFFLGFSRFFFASIAAIHPFAMSALLVGLGFSDTVNDPSYGMRLTIASEIPEPKILLDFGRFKNTRPKILQNENRFFFTAASRSSRSLTIEFPLLSFSAAALLAPLLDLDARSLTPALSISRIPSLSLALLLSCCC